MNTIAAIKQSFASATSPQSQSGTQVSKAELKTAIGIGTQNGKLTTGERVAIETGWEKLFRDGDGATLAAQREYQRQQKALGLRPHKLTADAVAQTPAARVAIRTVLSAFVAKLNAENGGGYSLVQPTGHSTRWTVRSQESELYYSVEGSMVRAGGSESDRENDAFYDIAHATPKGIAAAFTQATAH